MLLAAKEHGILRRAKSSLHFELPAQRLFYRNITRRMYTKVLAELIEFVTILLRNVVLTADTNLGSIESTD